MLLTKALLIMISTSRSSSIFEKSLFCKKHNFSDQRNNVCRTSLKAGSLQRHKWLMIFYRGLVRQTFQNMAGQANTMESSMILATIHSEMALKDTKEIGT